MMAMPDAHQWAGIHPTVTNFMILAVMSTSGVVIGMAKTTTATHRLKIRQGRAQEQNGCGAGEGGASILLTCAWHTATATLRLVGTTALAFVACQDPINPEPHEVRSLPAASAAPLPLATF